jgi:hypothetical protein
MTCSVIGCRVIHFLRSICMHTGIESYYGIKRFRLWCLHRIHQQQTKMCFYIKKYSNLFQRMASISFEIEKRFWTSWMIYNQCFIVQFEIWQIWIQKCSCLNYAFGTPLAYCIYGWINKMFLKIILKYSDVFHMFFLIIIHTDNCSSIHLVTYKPNFDFLIRIHRIYIQKCSCRVRVCHK